MYNSSMMMSFEMSCHIGTALSALIARNIFRMDEKSFISHMFLFYFTVDSIMGSIENFFFSC